MTRVTTPTRQFTYLGGVKQMRVVGRLVSHRHLAVDAEQDGELEAIV